MKQPHPFPRPAGTGPDPAAPTVHVSPGPGHAPHPIDLDTVITVLYLSAMDPVLWEQGGPEHIAELVLVCAENPQLRLPDLVALVRTARLLGPPFVRAAYLAQVEAFAPRVLDVFTTATTPAGTAPRTVRGDRS